MTTERGSPRRRMLPLLPLLLTLLMSLMSLTSTDAQAQSCTASATNITFSSVSPTSLQAVDATGTVTVSCTLPANFPQQNALICMNLTATEPRTLANGSKTLSYDLFTDAAHAVPWGSTAAGTTPITMTATTTAGTTVVTSAKYYGRVAANQPTVATVNNADTVYTTTYSAQTSAVAALYATNAATPTCASATYNLWTFPFTASATVVNNCSISATNLVFPTATTLTSTLTTQGTLTVGCTNGDAFKIAVSSGASGKISARTMARKAGAGSVAYQLYTDSARTSVWGDGTAGTAVQTGTGTGNTQSFTIYGAVPAQANPAIGSYSDTVTATVSF